MEAGMKCIKYLLFAFNLIFALTGLVLIAVGIVFRAQYTNYWNFLGDSFDGTPILLILIGFIIFFVTFFGCCGAIKENHCMTMTFSIVLSLILVVELASGIAAYVFRNEVSGIIQENMVKGLQNYGKDDFSGVTDTWDIVQHELKCCGVENYKNWRNTSFSADNGKSVPDSCCHSDMDNCGNGIFDMSEDKVGTVINTNGCFKKFDEFIKGYVEELGGTGIAIAVIQFSGIIFACVLAATIRKGYETV